MIRTDSVKVAAGQYLQHGVEGLWFKVRQMAGGAAPYLSAVVESKTGQKRLAEGLIILSGDLVPFEDLFRKVVFYNPTGTDITFTITVSDQGSLISQSEHVSVDNFPPVGGSDLPGTTDVPLAAASAAPVLIIAANVNRRSVVIASRLDNDPTAVPLRLGNLATVNATRGAQLGAGGEHVFDVTCAVYGWNPDPALAQNVTVLELLN